MISPQPSSSGATQSRRDPARAVKVIVSAGLRKMKDANVERDHRPEGRSPGTGESERDSRERPALEI